jgi:hypothetical protein
LMEVLLINLSLNLLSLKLEPSDASNPGPGSARGRYSPLADSCPVVVLLESSCAV